MTTTPPASTAPRLVLRRVFPVSRERLFDAWTQPESLQSFMRSCHGGQPPKVKLDVRVGGEYTIAMPQEKGEDFVVTGSYKVVDRPARLVCTWRWIEDDPKDEHETLLTLEFNEAAGGTELVLTHEKFRDEQQRDNHDKGWSEMLGRLGDILK